MVLEDSNTELSFEAYQFTLVGTSDYWEGPHNIALALKGRSSSLPVLAFTHNPDLLPELPSTVGFLIASHTYGGQVNLPFLGRLIVPPKYGQRYAAGPISDGSKQAFVNTGVGTSILPVRFRVPPEISILVFRSTTATSTLPASLPAHLD